MLGVGFLDRCSLKKNDERVREQQRTALDTERLCSRGAGKCCISRFMSNCKPHRAPCRKVVAVQLGRAGE